MRARSRSRTRNGRQARGGDVRAVQDERTAMLGAIAVREAAMLRVVQEEREAALQALAERNAETSAGRDALAADRAALDSEIGAMEAAARRQDSRVLLDVGGSLFTTSRTTLTAVPGSMLEAMFSGRHTIAAGEDGRVFIDRDGEHFRLILNFLRDCGSDAAAGAIRALSGAQLREARGELDYYGLDGAVFRGWFSLERAPFMPGPEMDIQRVFCSAVVLPGGREALVIGGEDEEGATQTTSVLDLGTMVFTAGPAMATARFGCAAVVLPDCSRTLVVGGHSGHTYLPSTELLSLGTMAFEPGPQMLSPRHGCAAVVLDARRVLVIGGGMTYSCHATTEVLDTGTMKFAPGPSMQARREGCAAVLLPGGRRVLVVGGHDGTTRLATTEILDIDTMTFAPGPVMSSDRVSCAIILLTGSILVVGGCDNDDLADTTEALSLQTMTFAAGPTTLTARYGCTAFVLPQDHSPRRALVVGVIGEDSSLLTTTEMLTAAG